MTLDAELGKTLDLDADLDEPVELELDWSSDKPMSLDAELEYGVTIGSKGITSITFNEEEHLPDKKGNVKIDEEDPTVPEWAKSSVKPQYEAAEVHAVATKDTFELEEIDNMFRAVFG